MYLSRQPHLPPGVNYIAADPTMASRDHGHGSYTRGPYVISRGQQYAHHGSVQPPPRLGSVGVMMSGYDPLLQQPQYVMAGGARPHYNNQTQQLAYAYGASPAYVQQPAHHSIFAAGGQPVHYVHLGGGGVQMAASAAQQYYYAGTGGARGQGLTVALGLSGM